MKTDASKFTIVAAICIILLLPIVACGANDNTPPPTLDDSPLISAMKMTPHNLRNFVFADVRAMRDDPELSAYLIEGEGPSGYLDSYRIDLNDMNQSAVASYTQGLLIIPPLQIATGEFDLENIRNLLVFERYTEHEFAGEEVWDVQIDDYMDSVAFLDDVILIGYGEEVRNAIDAIQDTRPSLYDEEDFRDVVSRLPLGMSIAFQEGEFLGRQTYKSLLVTGLSVAKTDENTIQLTWVIKFANADSAEDALDDVKSHVEEIKLPHFTNIKMVHEDQFIKVNAQTGIGSYFSGGTRDQNESIDTSNPSVESNS